MHEILIIFISLIVGFLIMKIIDLTKYQHAKNLKEKIIDSVKNRCIELYQKQAGCCGENSSNKALGLLSSVADCKVEYLPKEIKLIDLFCIEKSQCEDIKHANTIIYSVEKYYCPKAYDLYLDIEYAFEKYIKIHPELDAEKLRNGIFNKSLHSDDEIVEYILGLSIRQFCDKFNRIL